jgi:hypothetical protein
VIDFQTEKEVQDYIKAWLSQQGVSCEDEVVCSPNGIRADIVTPDAVIEVKKYLDREAIYQAKGQGLTYRRLLNRPKLLIMGLAPKSPDSFEQAQRIAEDVQTPDVEVIFIDKDPGWGLVQSSAESKAPDSPVPASVVESTKPAVTNKDIAQDPPNPVAQRKDLPQAVTELVTLLFVIFLFLFIKAAVGNRGGSEQPKQQNTEITP